MYHSNKHVFLCWGMDLLQDVYTTLVGHSHSLPPSLAPTTPNQKKKKAKRNGAAPRTGTFLAWPRRLRRRVVQQRSTHQLTVKYALRGGLSKIPYEVRGGPLWAEAKEEGENKRAGGRRKEHEGEEQNDHSVSPAIIWLETASSPPHSHRRPPGTCIAAAPPGQPAQEE